MSDDPETIRQIEALSLDSRPLLVLDVDEVVLEFVRPFVAFVEHSGFRFKTGAFRLHGNVLDAASGEPAPDDVVSGLLDRFFAAQEDWQTAANGAARAIASFGDSAEVVMLTAMPHAHRERRRRLLDGLGMPWPLVTTETAKGPAVAMLAGKRTAPVAFVDDIPLNLVSVRKSYPRASLIHLIAHAEMRAMLPPLPEGIAIAKHWDHARDLIAGALGI